MSEIERNIKKTILPIKKTILPTDAKIGDIFYSGSQETWTCLKIPNDFEISLGMTGAPKGSLTLVYDSIILDPTSFMQLVYTGKKCWACITLIGHYYTCNFKEVEVKKTNWITNLWNKVTRN